MSLPYYRLPERQAVFAAEARSWLGTPFVENAAVKGRLGGVDCVRLAAEVHFTCGALDRFSIPKMPVEWVRSWHEHHAESRLLSFFGQPAIRSRLRKIDSSEPPMVGDVAVILLGLTEHHVALWCGPVAIHVARAAGVLTVSTSSPEFRKTIRSFYRVHES